MPKQQRYDPQAESFANSLCRDVGHDWRTTASERYRRCQREKCKAVQRWQDGTWIAVSVARPWHDPLVAYAKKQTLPKQASLFS